MGYQRRVHGVDEKVLFDTFSAFGVIFGTPKIVKNPETGKSKGHGFVSFNDFEAADAASDAMNSQYLMNRKIVVQYSHKKDNTGERHGSLIERQLALKLKAKGALPSAKPNFLFSSGPNIVSNTLVNPQMD